MTTTTFHYNPCNHEWKKLKSVTYFEGINYEILLNQFKLDTQFCPKCGAIKQTFLGKEK